MAANISIVNGVAEAMYAVKPAWHGLGVVLDTPPNSEEAMKAAHLDWHVSLKPLKTDDGIEVPGFYASCRDDINVPLGIVGNQYKIVQNVEAFNFLDGLLQDGIMKYEAAGALRGGAIVWVLARMPSSDEIAEGDTCDRFILFATSHDGSKSLHAIPTQIRVVCQNTLTIATAGLEGIRHIGDMGKKLSYAKKYLSQFDEKFTMFRDKARELVSKKLDMSTAKGYINTLFPEVEEEGRGQTRRDNIVAKINANLVNEKQTIASIKGTWWAAFNAVSEYIDHQSTFKGENDSIRAENRMLSILEGNAANAKDRAFTTACEMAGV